ncbi:MAG TPA: hypothetical protein VJV79_13665 [Polyangiaceae bacterium]|nr:hypothetical protein [Polyangiaceae bacterium]
MSRYGHSALKTACLAASLGCLSGCSSDVGSGTAGKRVVLHTVLSAEPAAQSEFTTGFGWDVKLAEAKLALGAFYYFEGPPPTAHFMRRRSLGERFSGYFLGTAWAHPGHYQPGTALGEAIFANPIVFDLFSGAPVQVSDGAGVTGIYRSARVVLPRNAPPDPLLDGHLALAVGQAVKHGDPAAGPVYFRLIADYDDIAMNVNEGAVDGCVLDEATVTADGTITIEVNPTIWLNLVDFSKIAAGSVASPTEARNSGFSQGLTQLSAYHFSYGD